MPRYARASVLIGLDREHDDDAWADVVARAVGGELAWRPRVIPGVAQIRVPPGREDQVVELLRLLPGVRYAHRDGIGHLDRQVGSNCGPTPNDPYFNDQWALMNTGGGVRAQAGWLARHDAPNIIVAVLDSGVNYLHAELAPNMWTNTGEIPGNGIDDDGDGIIDDIHGAGFEPDLQDGVLCQEAHAYAEGDPYDARGCCYPNQSASDPGGHGTAVATIVGAIGNNFSPPASGQVTGLAWVVRIMPIRVANCETALTSSSVAKGIDFVIAKRAAIANCSFGLGKDDTLYDAFKAAAREGILVVCSAGNLGGNIDYPAGPAPGAPPQFPASYAFSNVVAVGASTALDQREAFSNFGPVSVDLFAPGAYVRVLDGALNSTPPSYFGGTSAAAPHVAAAAALALQEGVANSATDLVVLLRATARPVPSLSGLCVSGGILDVHNLLNQPCN